MDEKPSNFQRFAGMLPVLTTTACFVGLAVAMEREYDPIECRDYGLVTIAPVFWSALISGFVAAFLARRVARKAGAREMIANAAASVIIVTGFVVAVTVGTERKVLDKYSCCSGGEVTTQVTF